MQKRSSASLKQSKNGSGERRAQGKVPNPPSVAPGVGIVCADEAGGVGQTGGTDAIGIGFIDRSAIGAGDVVFIRAAFVAPGRKDLPHTVLQVLHGQIFRVPEVELAHHTDVSGVGGPDPEDISGLPPANGTVAAQELVGPDAGALMESFQKLFCFFIHIVDFLPFSQNERGEPA